MTLRVSLLCLIYASVFLSCQTLCWLLYLPPSLRFLSTHTFSLIFVPFHVSSPSIFSFLFFCPVFYTLSFCLLSDISPQFTALLYLPLDIFSPRCSFGHCPPSSFLLTYIYTYMCAYICLCSTLDLPFSSWNKIMTSYVDSLILLRPFVISWNTLLLPILKHTYRVDWRIKYVGNVPKFSSELEKAARSGCTVNRPVIVLPLTVPEEDCKPPEPKELMAFSSHF